MRNLAIKTTRPKSTTYRTIHKKNLGPGNINCCLKNIHGVKGILHYYFLQAYHPLKHVQYENDECFNILKYITAMLQ